MRKPLLLLTWAVAAFLTLQTVGGINEFDDDITFDDVPTRPEGPGRPEESSIGSRIINSLSRIKRGLFDFWDVKTDETTETTSAEEVTKDDSTTSATFESPSPVGSTVSDGPTHSREGRSTTKSSGSSSTRESDDEDYLSPASGSGSEVDTTRNLARSESYVIFRIRIFIHEFWTPSLAQKNSPEFERFAKNFTQELEKFYDSPVNDDPPLPGSRRATVIGIEPSEDTMLILVTADLGSKGYGEADTIKHRLRRHLEETSRLGDLPVKIDKTHPLTIQKFTEPNTNGFSPCDVTQLACTDGITCLSLDARCDGRNDCPNGSDEEGCPTTPSVVTAQRNIVNSEEVFEDLTPARCDDRILCPNKKNWICASMKCDGNQDCPDKSEEDGCPEEVGTPSVSLPTVAPSTTSSLTYCFTNEFMCDLTRCVQHSQRCDGRADCADGTDEQDCPKNPCLSSQFTCDDGECIELSEKCNRVPNCADGSDEKDCDKACNPPDFRCSNGTCIPGNLKCNSRPDCPNGEDEREPECPSRPLPCLDSEFTCNSGQCVHKQYVCDKINDCLDKSDEDEARCREDSCMDDDFYCLDTNQCIRSGLHCDGTRHCDDGSDESNCPRVCGYKEYACANGQCIQASQRCSGEAECSDGSDEEGCYATDSQFEETNITLSLTPAGYIPLVIYKDVQFRCQWTSNIPVRAEMRQVWSYRGLNAGTHLGLRGEDRAAAVKKRLWKTGEEVETIRLFDNLASVQCLLLDDRDRVVAKAETYVQEDEAGQCNAYTDFTCDDGQCVSKSAKCNGVEDCSDGSDESNCITNEIQLVTSPTSQEIEESKEAVFQCRDEGPSRHRVRWMRGDGQPLPEGSRTLNNGARLEIPNVQVNASGAYICEAVGAPRLAAGSKTTVYLRVTPFIRIPDTHFPEIACQYYEATCYNRQCIPKESVCDGKIDCSDGSDESRCSEHACEANHFMCANKECILKTWRCDNQKDCLDGSDEVGCNVSKNGTCYTTEFACRSGNQCIPRGMLCDKQKDCADNSDEIGCKDPDIVIPPRAIVSLCQGEELTLTCQSSGFPIPFVNWRLNWGHVPPKCRMLNEDGLGTLVCPDMRSQESGAYSCEAINGRSKFAIPDANVIVRSCNGTTCEPGTFNEIARSPDDCIKCFCFGRSTDCKSANLYSFKLPAPTNPFRLVSVRFDQVVDVYTGYSAVQNYLTPSYNGFEIHSPIGGNGTQYSYYSMPEETHKNQLKSYGGYITYKVTPGGDTRSPYLDIPDVVITGNDRVLTYRRREPLARDRENEVSVRLFEGDWQITSPSENRHDDYATREDIMMVLHNIENILIRTQYIEGTGIDTAITDINMDSAHFTNTGLAKAAFVEECSCPRGYVGLSCEECAPGFQRQPGSFLGVCSETPPGPVDCRPGFYGAPERGIPCRRCPCPLTNYPGALTTCRLGPGNEAICDCREGYVGERCQSCDVRRGYTGDARLGTCAIRVTPQCSPDGSTSTDPIDGTCECKPFATGSRCDQCVQDAFHLSANNTYGCIKCFCMGTTKECTSSNLYRDSIETTFYGTSPQDFSLVKKTRDDLFEKITPVVDPSTRELYFDNFDTEVYYWALPPAYLFDKVTSYGGNLEYTIRYTPSPGGLSSKNNAADVEIRSANRITLSHFAKQNIEPEQTVKVSVPLLEQHWQSEFGRLTDREHLLQALADVSGIYIKATYTTSTSRASLISVSLDTATGRNTGRPKAVEVEQCRCLPGYIGTSCEDCAPGYKRTEDGIYLGICEPCECGGYSEDCDPDSGECRNCRDNRVGAKCESCAPGSSLTPEGDCQTQESNACQSCDSRGTITCRGDRCVCKVNAEGARCDRCRPGTFHLSSDDDAGCSDCYCSEVTTECSSSSLYMQPVPAFIIDDNHGFTLSNGASTVIRDGFRPNYGESEIGYRTGWRQERLFWSLPSKLTGDKVLSYGGALAFTQRYTSNAPDPQPTSDHDIIISGNSKSIFYTFDEPLQPDQRKEQSVKIAAGKWRILDQRSGNPIATRQDILKVLSNVDHILIRASLAQNIEETYISDVLLETATQNNYGPRADQVEVCRCPPEYRGTSCQSCAEGHYRNYDNTCKRCPCVHGRSCLLGSDYDIKCKCDPGWEGKRCEEPENYSNVTISMTPAGRLKFYEGDSHIFRCEYKATCPVRAEILEVYSFRSGHTSRPTFSLQTALWASGHIERTVRITQSLSSVDCVLIDENEEVVGRTQAYIKVEQTPEIPPAQPLIRIEVSVSPEGVVKENSRVTLQCTAQAQSREQVSIRWSKQDGRLPPRIIDDGRGRLTILNAHSADSGIYLCTVRTSNATETRSVIVTVDADQTDERPYISIYPSTTIEALEGSEIYVQCTSRGYPLPDIEWLRLNGRRFNEEAEIDGGNIRIRSALKNDEGEYECRASNRAGYDYKLVTVHVRTSSETAGKLSIEPREINALTGQTISIRCIIEPPSDLITLQWRRNDRRDFPRRAESYNGELTIRDVTPLDAGEYVCTATGSTGYKVSEASAYIRVRTDRPTSFSVSVTPPRLTVDERDTAVFTCNSSLPDAEIKWSVLQRKESRGRSELPRKAQAYNNILRIPNVEWSDRAVYVCQGNLAGTIAGAQAFLEVRRRGIAPVIELSERRVTLLEGGSTLVDCRPSGGSPSPQVTWSKRNSFLPRNIVQEGNLLRFNGVQLGDTGEYVCTAENSAGKTTAILRLDVQKRPKIRTDPSGSVRKNIGERLTLNCLASGVPVPVVRWEINTPAAVRSNLEGTTGTGSAQYEVYRLSEEDSGSYVCRATSPAGEREETVYVQVLDNEVDPSGPSHRTFSVDLGGGTEFTCSHPSDTEVEYSWSRRDGRPFGRGVANYGERLVITNAEMTDAGEYVCEVRDRNGLSQTSTIATLNVVERLNIRLMPESQIVQPNENPEILCRVIGDKPADITWEGVDRKLPATAVTNGGRIRFNNIQPEDQGRYMCIAIDPVTRYSVKALARVTVKDRRPAPSQTRLTNKRYWAQKTQKYQRPQSCNQPEHFLCHNGVQCIKYSQYCNGVSDCNDRSDEHFCTSHESLSDNDQSKSYLERADHPPTVAIIGDKNITKTEGASLHLQCVVTDTPNVRIDWRRQGHSLPRNADTSDRDLIIPNLYPDDSGIYICTATSPSGLQGQDQVTVNVQQGCSAVGKIACKDGITCYTSSQMCDGYDDCPDGSDENMCRQKRNHGALVARVLIEPSVDRIRVGETVDLRCIVEGVFASDEPMWEKVGGRVADNVITRGNFLRIQDVTSDNAGRYRCWVKKQSGQIVEDEYLLEVQDDNPSYDVEPERPHNHVQRLAEKTKAVQVYDSVDIECDTGLEPPVTFIWTKRNSQLLANQTGSKIHLTNVLLSDAGEYLCVASNSEVKIEFPTFLVVKGTIPRFTQQTPSFLKLKPIGSPGYLKLEMLLSIKPERPTGLILYNGNHAGSKQDFIAIGLKNARVELRFDVGSGEAVIVSNVTVPMGKWSNITIKRNRKEGKVWVNGIGPFIGTSHGRYQGLDLTEPIYLGNVPNFTAIKPSVGFDSGFSGCISFLKINDQVEELSKPLEKTNVNDCDTCSKSQCRNNGVCQEAPNERGYQCLCPRGFSGEECQSVGSSSACYPGLCGDGKCINTHGSYKCQCKLGTAGENCEQNIKVKTPQFSGNSFLAYPIPLTASDFSLNLDVQLDDARNSLLAYAGQHQNGHGDFIALTLRDQQIEFTVDTGSGPETIRNPYVLPTGKWVNIKAKKRADELSLNVNGDFSDKVLDARKTKAHKKGLNLHTPLYIGGHDDSTMSLHPSVFIKDGFRGCIRSVSVNGRPPTNLIKNAVESSNVRQCHKEDINLAMRDNLCGEQRCLNGGSCDHSDGTPVCQCTSNYGGSYCEIRTNECGQEPNPCGSNGVCQTEKSIAEGYKCDCFFGFTGPTCQERVSITTDASFRRESYIELPGHLTNMWRSDDEVSISMIIQTEELIGLLFWQGTDGHYMSIGVKDGYVEAEVDHNDNPLTLRARGRVDDARPHNLTVTNKASDLEITLDGVTVASTNGQPPRRMPSRESIFIGGLPDPWTMTNGRWRENFVGCISRLRVNNNEPIDFAKHNINARNVRSCLSSNRTNFWLNNETK